MRLPSGILVTLRSAFVAALALAGGACSHVPEPTTDFRPVATLINATIRANHYRPTELDSVRYRQIENGVIALGATAESGEAFRTGFNGLWKNGPFSHVALLRA